MRLLLAMVAVMALAGQSASSRMVGSWTAQFDGQTYVRLDLKSSNGTLSGGLSLGNVEVDKTGALLRVGEAPRELTPVFDVTATDTTLRFSRKEGRDTDRFELKLNEAGRAELHLLLTDQQLRELAADQGVPAPKPFLLTKR